MKTGPNIWLLLLLLGVIFLNACSKSESPSTERKLDPNQVISVTDARKWYESQPIAGKKKADLGYIGGQIGNIHFLLQIPPLVVY